MDDTFVIHKVIHKEDFLQHINSVDPAIQFTVDTNKEDGEELNLSPGVLKELCPIYDWGCTYQCFGLKWDCLPLCRLIPWWSWPALVFPAYDAEAGVCDSVSCL